MPFLAANVLGYGVPDPLPPTRLLHAGPVSALLEDADLRYIRLGQHELLRRIYVAVRNRNWGTVLPVFSNWQIQTTSDSFHISFDATHQQGEIDFVWRGELNGTPDGTITYSMDGLARSTFWRNRIGFCVLHPAEASGAPADLVHTDGSAERTEFPLWVQPAQPVLPFANLSALTYHVTPEIAVKVQFEGDVFELEDQRNWTDASYKTFSTPLSLPFPVEVPEGTRIFQKLTITVTTPRELPSVRVDSGKAFAHIQLSAETAPLPEIGLGSASHGNELSAGELATLKQLAPAHLRVDLNPDQPNWQAALERAAQEARALGVPLEAALLLSDTPTEQLRALRAAFDANAPTVKRWLIYPNTEHMRLSPPLRDMVIAAREHLGSYDTNAQFVAGTNTDFIFLSRKAPPVDLLDAVCFALHPQAHAFDQRSVAETLQAQQYVVNTARHISGLPVMVTPITFKPRFNPYASGAEAPVPEGTLPPQVDPRQLSLFGAGWTAITLKYLTVSGAASLTFYETTGWRGVMETAAGSPLPDKFPSQPGMLFPLFHVLADVAELRGGQTLQVKSSEPLIVDVLGLKRGGVTRLLVCNLTNAPAAMTLEPIAAHHVTVKHLNAQTAEQAMLDGSTFRQSPGEQIAVENGKLNLELRPYEVTRVDITEE